MLTSRLGSFEDLRVADLYAGSGALGIEALSRGARHCLFVEQDREALAVLRANLAMLGTDERASIHPGSVLSLRPARRACDVILIDPPYRAGNAIEVLCKIARLGWIAPTTWIAIETAAKTVKTALADHRTTTPITGDYRSTTPITGDYRTTTPITGDYRSTTPITADYRTTAGFEIEAERRVGKAKLTLLRWLGA